MEIMAIDYMKLINLIFCVTVVILAFIRFKKTAVRAFLFICLAYVLFGVSWLTQLMGWDVGVINTFLTSVRTGGYCMLILGLLL